MAMRNFWIEGEIDGRKTKLTGGPVRKDGGFKLVVYVRDGGESVPAFEVSGTSDPETGQLTVVSQALNQEAQVVSVTNR